MSAPDRHCGIESKAEKAGGINHGKRDHGTGTE
jgi:hypothetical protein